MPRSSFSGALASPKLEVIVDMGNPFLNRTVDGFLKIGTVGASRVAAEETYHCLQKGNISGNKVKQTLKKMCKEGAYWGTIAGVYVGMEYGVERIRGTREWGARPVDLINMDGISSDFLDAIYATRDGNHSHPIFAIFFRTGKNALISGAITGALVSAASNNHRDKVVVDAITGGAIATAAEFLNYLT